MREIEWGQFINHSINQTINEFISSSIISLLTHFKHLFDEIITNRLNELSGKKNGKDSQGFRSKTGNSMKGGGGKSFMKESLYRKLIYQFSQRKKNLILSAVAIFFLRQNFHNYLENIDFSI